MKRKGSLVITPQIIKEKDDKATQLLLTFIAMVIVGLGNKIFQKLQTIPMYNYPTFLTLVTTIIYIPLCFAYIIPMIKYGHSITQAQQSIPKSFFAVMGFFDASSGIAQVFASVYLGGSLLILLGQAAIPVSMILSSMLLNTRYTTFQYLGAVLVCIGLGVALNSNMHHTPSSTSYDFTRLWDASSNTSDILFWSIVMILSCVPMCLSGVYKERMFGEINDLDPVYLCGWIAFFQMVFLVPMAVPAGTLSEPPVPVSHFFTSLRDGAYCLVGINTIQDTDHPDNCSMAPYYVTAYLIFNVAYNLLIILILKFGSANILWLAMTIMVPLGNVAFALPFMPGNMPLQINDILALVIIMAGLFIYRFMENYVPTTKFSIFTKNSIDLKAGEDELRQALIHVGDESDEDV